MINDIELFEVYFQKSKVYYTEKLQRFNNGEKYTFNVTAFFFGIAWFLYRKMYVEAVAIFGILILETVFDELFINQYGTQTTVKLVSLIINIITAGLVGGMANYLYFTKANKIIALAKINFNNNDKQIVFLKKNGGVNLALLMVVIAIIVLLIAYFFIVNNPD